MVSIVPIGIDLIIDSTNEYFRSWYDWTNPERNYHLQALRQHK
jgi:hypothetical protein